MEHSDGGDLSDSEAERTGRDEAEAASGDFVDLPRESGVSADVNEGSSSNHSDAHALLGETAQQGNDDEYGYTDSDGSIGGSGGKLRTSPPCTAKTTDQQSVSDFAMLEGVSAKDMEWGGWRAHPRELSREFVSCSKGGTALVSKTGRRRKPSEVVPTDARLRNIRNAKAREKERNASITHGIVYKLTSPSGEAYIGISKYKIEKRLLWHKNNSSCCRAIKEALQKYGFESFKKETLHSNIPLADLPALEVEEIRRHGTLAPNGYNLTPGGKCNPMDTAGARAKVSDAKTSFWKSKSAEYKNDVLKATRTPEVRKRATETNLARWLERAKAKAATMNEADGAKYLKQFLRNRELRELRKAKREALQGSKHD